jgi:hypothetical protein
MCGSTISGQQVILSAVPLVRLSGRSGHEGAALVGRNLDVDGIAASYYV